VAGVLEAMTGICRAARALTTRWFEHGGIQMLHFLNR
jgi:hypothetical protein